MKILPIDKGFTPSESLQKDLSELSSLENCLTCRFRSKLVFETKMVDGSWKNVMFPDSDADVWDIKTECLRYPPTLSDMQDQVHVRSPEVDISHWCGEWRPVRDKDLKNRAHRSTP